MRWQKEYIERYAKINKKSFSRDEQSLGHLIPFYTKAIEWGKATDNPVKKVKLFKENNQRVRFLEKGEIKILLDACAEFLKPIVIVALNTGMRQGKYLI